MRPRAAVPEAPAQIRDDDVVQPHLGQLRRVCGDVAQVGDAQLSAKALGQGDQPPQADGAYRDDRGEGDEGDGRDGQGERRGQ